jgi:hypothetical protein
MIGFTFAARRAETSKQRHADADFSREDCALTAGVASRIPAKTKNDPATFKLLNIVHLLLQHAAILEVLRRRFAPNSR